MVKELTEKEVSKKYSNIEDKIPSIWPDWISAAIELSQDIAFLWNIRDVELYRVISLVGTRTYNLNYTENFSTSLYSHLDLRFSYMGLYPEIQKPLNILPDNLKISEVLSKILDIPDFKLVTSGSLTGESFKRIASILDDTIKGDFLIFDNLGGKAFDVMVNFDEEDRVASHVKWLEKEHPSWIWAYRIDHKEVITETLRKKIFPYQDILDSLIKNRKK